MNKYRHLHGYETVWRWPGEPGTDAVTTTPDGTRRYPKTAPAPAVSSSFWRGVALGTLLSLPAWALVALLAGRTGVLPW